MDLSKYIGSKGSKYLDGSKYINDDWDIFSSEQSTDIFKDATIYDIWLNTNTCGGDRFKENKTMKNQEGIECMDKISINHWMTMNRLSWLILLFGFIPMECIMQGLIWLRLPFLGALVGCAYIFNIGYLFYTKFKLKQASIGNYVLIDNKLYIWKIYDLTKHRELTAFEIFKMLEENDNTLIGYMLDRLSKKEFNYFTYDKAYNNTYFYLEELESTNKTLAGHNTINQNDAIQYVIPWTCRTKVQVNRLDLEAWDNRIDYNRMYIKNETYDGFVNTFRNMGFMG